MDITNSTSEDVYEVLRLCKNATDYQKMKSVTAWPEFERSLIEIEVAENRQWKMMSGNSIVCIWASAFSDPLIWEEQNKDPSVYIHRIAVSPSFMGQKLVTEIVKWAKIYAAENGKKFIRMDTVGRNEKLIAHYQNCGFKWSGFTKLKNTEGLPLHYHDAMVCLFELVID